MDVEIYCTFSQNVQLLQPDGRKLHPCLSFKCENVTSNTVPLMLETGGRTKSKIR